MKKLIDIGNIEKINWQWNYQDFKSKFPFIDEGLGYLEFIGKIRDVDFKGIMQFSENSEKLTKMTLLIPPDVFNNSREGSEINDYLNTYCVLEQVLGLPVISEGVKTPELKKLNNIYDVSSDLLPKNIWVLDKFKITHTFIDHWGLVPETFASKE